MGEREVQEDKASRRSVSPDRRKESGSPPEQKGIGTVVSATTGMTFYPKN